VNTIQTKITMQLIADRLGVSKYTVSQALSGKTGVSEATRGEVIAMARALGYRFPAAKKTVSWPTETAPLKSDAAANPHSEELRPCVAIWIHEAQRDEPSFWSRVLDGTIRGCRDHGWQTQVFSFSRLSKVSKSGSIENAPLASCIGAIVLGTLPIRSLNKVVQLQAADAPIILVDHEEPLLQADCILNANLEAAQLACRRILSQGCRRIVFVGKDHFSVSFKERWWGCRQALDEHARQTDGCTLKKWTIPYGQPAWEQQLARRIASLRHDELPDGFVCANDEIALKLLELLQEQSVAVPDCCKVIGIDNIDASASSTPPLTTVELAKELLGWRAVEALARNLAQPSVHAEKIILSARLIVRGSG
jgi:LacI family transcriptional regulator